MSITSPADGASFNSGATVLFEGTASDLEDGDLTGILVWKSSLQGQIDVGGSFSYILEDGNHIITATVTDSGDQTGSASISITVGDQPTEPTKVSVSRFTYATTGGRNGDKHLSVSVALVDDFGDPVVGASVSSQLENDLGSSWTFTGTTGPEGTVTFSVLNAPSGWYTTKVTGVTAAGLAWDPEDLDNVSEPFKK